MPSTSIFDMPFSKVYEALVNKAVKKGRTLIFHWRGGYMTREIVQEFLKIFKEEAEKKGKHAKVFLNWAQAVVKVQFIEQVPVEELTMEEANEGEKE